MENLINRLGGKMVFNKELKREIREGWEVVPIKHYADIIDPHPSHRAPKKADKGFPFAGIGDIDFEGNISINKARVISEEFVSKQERDYTLTEYSLGYGRVGTVGKVVKLRKQTFRYALSPTMAVINPKDEKHAGYIYNSIKDTFFYKMVLKNTAGTTRPAIGIQLLREIPILKPSSKHYDMFERFEKISKQYLKRISLSNRESQNLIELRDWLLPMLMNGQVTVPSLRGKPVLSKVEARQSHEAQSNDVVG
ncbi:restriction endonuclease subunit S [Lacinutrix neustonica]|uniref:Restriction endonuclease subunit S n=1 Tax=Lacinutrix neustonica TaxID=2980107 RepID=A0A9E8MWL2_9FLAO|nr:restriction endonuclease subunit S [Lacinutrix neustonica]WAC02259.1 restriction endonuclease subunit S [Lacinutrix neustonica]